MRIYLGAHLNFYHPNKEKWLQIDLEHPKPLDEILEMAGIPKGEVHMVVLNDEISDLEGQIISPQDEVKLFPAVGGGS
jgi:molybdopterin converting factor small subunit